MEAGLDVRVGTTVIRMAMFCMSLAGVLGVLVMVSFIVVVVLLGMLIVMFVLCCVGVGFEQRALGFGLFQRAACSIGNGEQCVRPQQLLSGVGERGEVLGRTRHVLEADDIRRRAVQFDHQLATVDHQIEGGHTVLVGVQAGGTGMFLIMIAVAMVIMVVALGLDGKGEGA